jgi:hypothetical protein
MKLPRKLIPPDSHGLFYQMAGILSHSQPRNSGSGGSAVYQLLPLRCTSGLGPSLEVPPDTGGFVTPRIERDTHDASPPAVR